MPRTPRRPGDPPARGRQPRKPKRPKVPRDAPLDVHWDDFYARRGGRFYKDRHWLRRELPELMPAAVRADPLRHQAPLESDGEAVDRSDAFPAARELAGCGVVGAATGPDMRSSSWARRTKTVGGGRPQSMCGPSRVRGAPLDLPLRL